MGFAISGVLFYIAALLEFLGNNPLLGAMFLSLGALYTILGITRRKDD